MDIVRLTIKAGADNKCEVVSKIRKELELEAEELKAVQALLSGVSNVIIGALEAKGKVTKAEKVTH